MENAFSNMTTFREHAYICWLCCVQGVGNRTVTALREYFGSAERVFTAGEEELRELTQIGILKAGQLEALLQDRRKADPEREYERLKERGIGFLAPDAADYPERLRQIPDAPQGLFFMGKLPSEDELSVAVIGARDCSEYGRYVAAELGKTLGRRGVQVISGMARGIDGISQEAALEAGGASFGVLGCGVDVCYPAQNKALYEKLLCRGGVLSAFAPGMAAKPRHFPPRNRIVSGLADAVVVIEARQKSGTLITVDMALEQGREVYVVPGRVTDRLSDGCNKLLKQGAGVFLSPEDFLSEMEELSLRRAARNRKPIRESAKEVENGGKISVPTNKTPPESELEAVYKALDFYPQSAEQIGERLGGGHSVQELNRMLMQLCMSKRASQVSPGYFQVSVL